jgi:hypothetical protein
MINPKTLLGEWVTALQALPNLVEALGGDGTRIQFYTENTTVFGQPTQNNIRLDREPVHPLLLLSYGNCSTPPGSSIGCR